MYEEHHTKKLILLAGLLGGAGLLTWSSAQSQTGTGSAPRVKVGPTVAAKANAPAPSATARNQSQKPSIGKGATSVKSSAPASFWTDQVDIDDDDTVEDMVRSGPECGAVRYSKGRYVWMQVRRFGKLHGVRSCGGERKDGRAGCGSREELND
jgi:hypothetical protein